MQPSNQGEGSGGAGRWPGVARGRQQGREGDKVQNSGALWGLCSEPWERWKVGLASEANSCCELGRELTFSLHALQWQSQALAKVTSVRLHSNSWPGPRGWGTCSRSHSSSWPEEGASNRARSHGKCTFRPLRSRASGLSIREPGPRPSVRPSSVNRAEHPNGGQHGPGF